MATPGDKHELIVSFLVPRLQKLYPEAKITCGKVVKPVGLKPDVYMELPDGRKWVFEAVFANRNPEKIKQNHQRYQQAGISDTWILWDDLGPRTGQEIFPDQSSFSTSLTPPCYKLTQPQKALLDIQGSYPKYIYSFVIDDGMGIARSLPQSNFINALMMGVCIYEFDGEMIKNRYRAIKRYVQLSDLDLDDAGKIKIQEVDHPYDKLLEEMGVSQFSSPSEILVKILQLLTSQCVIRRKAATESGACRPPKPEDVGQ